MTPHELIRSSFRSLQPRDDLAESVLSAAEEKQHSHRWFAKGLIAAAIACCLVVSVAAIGYTCGWLDRWLDTGSNPDYFESKTLYPQAEGAVDGLSATLDKFLCDGPFIYYQVTLHSDTGFHSESYREITHTVISYPEPIPLADGSYDYGPGSIGSEQRLDDGSDPNLRTYAVSLVLFDHNAQRLVLSLSRQPTIEEADAAFPEGVMLKELLRYEFQSENESYREAALEDGTKIRIHSLGVGIQGYRFFGWEDENGNQAEGRLDAATCGVILKDGTKLHFLTSSLGYYDTVPPEEHWNNSPLPRVIVPEEVVAIFTEDAVYPLA
ncbi:MAG: hypothetical protein IJA48_03780 [Oscillospiraceae bacterium]|nr:hypothetical protein [Oscillospiraceae bacterium]